MNSISITITAFACFAVIHSLTVSLSFKKRLASLTGLTWMRAYYRLLFTIFSVIITVSAAYVIFTQPDTQADLLIWRPSMPLEIACRTVQLAGVAIMLAAFGPFDLGYFTGLRQALTYIETGRTGGDIEGLEDNVLVTGGIYGLVRHPMYLGGILVFFFEPYINLNSLALRMLAVFYFICGALIEDRRLIAQFGGPFLEYKSRVPMFNIIKRLPSFLS
ncbi:MAG: isoprenylcysteine carboxylmethyltransferase family protein [Nitrospirota bacterium]